MKNHLLNILFLSFLFLFCGCSDKKEIINQPARDRGVYVNGQPVGITASEVTNIASGVGSSNFESSVYSNNIWGSHPIRTRHDTQVDAFDLSTNTYVGPLSGNILGNYLEPLNHGTVWTNQNLIIWCDATFYPDELSFVNSNAVEEVFTYQSEISLNVEEWSSANGSIIISFVPGTQTWYSATPSSFSTNWGLGSVPSLLNPPTVMTFESNGTMRFDRQYMGYNGTNAYVSVSNTVTLAGGSPAYVSNSVVGSTNKLIFGIPAGVDGVALMGSNLTVNLMGQLLQDPEGSNTHFQISYDYTNAFTSPISVYTTNSVVGWMYFNGTTYQPFPINGLPSNYQDTARGCVTYDFTNVVLTRVWVRARSWDGIDWSPWFSKVSGAGEITLGSP